MADSIVTDVSKMQVVDLRKELKARGLPHTGNKADLVARLQAAIMQDSQDDHGDGDINLDSDEIDSDGVLDEDDKMDEDDKSQNDILDDPADTLNEELALAEQSPLDSPPPKPVDTKPQKTLKRKITASNTSEDKASVKTEEKKAVAKKIVLNRPTSISSAPKVEEKVNSETVKIEPASEAGKVKISTDLDPKTRLELRAKRFGLPVKMSDEERKEARRNRFIQNASLNNSKSDSPTLSENLEKLKKRAERFGQSVSKVMVDIENKEKLEKRKAKFGIAK